MRQHLVAVKIAVLRSVGYCIYLLSFIFSSNYVLSVFFLAVVRKCTALPPCKQILF